MARRVVAAFGPLWLPLLLAAPGGANAQGPWIFGYFVEKMDCVYDRAEADLWDGLADFLFEPQAQALEPSPARMSALAAKMHSIMMPFGVADPVVALTCPLGASAALYELATLCVGTRGESCIPRALRVLHLAKLMLLFNFNDYGAWFDRSRWQLDMNKLASAVQSLAKVSKAQGDTAPMLAPADLREPGWNIGLVTYCNYNDSHTRLKPLSRSSKAAYAARHGYKLLHFEKPFVTNVHPWMNKLIAIQRNLADFDWLFWVDCDLFFMNPHLTVDALIRSALHRNPNASLLIAEDGMMLNSGSFLMRNNAWGHDFLARTVDLLAAPMPHSFQHMPWHEQAPLMYLTLMPSVLEGLADAWDPTAAAAPMDPGYDPRVVLMPQRAINSYPPEVVQKTQHAMPHEAWEEGDLTISFNGCSSILGGDFCEAMYSRYHGMSMDRLAQPR